MVKLKDVKLANAEYVTKKSLVVVSAGGTSGIGQTTLRELCATAGETHTKGAGLYIYMIGRKEETVNKLVTEFTGLAPNAGFRYIPAKDLSIMKGVDEACREIINAEKARSGDSAKIDLLIETQAIFNPWLGKKDTTDGLDINFALLYYSRMRMIDQLLPLLTARTAADGPAHVISVNAAGMEKHGGFFKDDLSLQTHYGFSNARTHSIYMTTMFFEHIANDHPGKISLNHMYPGLVIHPSFSTLLAQKHMPLWVRTLAPILIPIAKITVATPVPESGQRTLFLASKRYPARPMNDDKRLPNMTSLGVPIAVATDGTLGGGAYSCTQNDETSSGIAEAYAKLRAEGLYDLVWQHTHKVFDTVTAGQAWA